MNKNKKGIHSETVRFHAESHWLRCACRRDHNCLVAQQSPIAREAHNTQGDRHVCEFDQVEKGLQVSRVLVGLVRGEQRSHTEHARAHLQCSTQKQRELVHSHFDQVFAFCMGFFIRIFESFFFFLFSIQDLRSQVAISCLKESQTAKSRRPYASCPRQTTTQSWATWLWLARQSPSRTVSTWATS